MLACPHLSVGSDPPPEPGPFTLTSHHVIAQTIAATITRRGLKVHAELDTAAYPTGVKIGDEQMKALETQGILTRHGFHGEWNYCLNPTADDTPDSNDLK